MSLWVRFPCRLSPGGSPNIFKFVFIAGFSNLLSWFASITYISVSFQFGFHTCFGGELGFRLRVPSVFYELLSE